jgi:RNA polymerase sigma-70 factor (ECF subfamily)
VQTDSELVIEILNGSQAAMEILVRKHYEAVFTYAYRQTGDYHTASDITQDVFIKMMKGLTTYRERDKFKSWLFRIAVNCCRDSYRCASARTAREVELDAEFSDLQSNIWDIFSKRVEREYLQEALDSLPEFQKEVVLLRFYHDLKLKEIADLTGSGEATVKSRLYQALEKLKKRLLAGEGELGDNKKNRFKP